MKPSRIFIASIAIVTVMSACTSVSTSAPRVSVVPPEASLTLTHSSAPTDSTKVQPVETRPPAPPPTATRAPAPPTSTVTPPAPNPAYPLLTARLEAIQVSDDDGTRATGITKQQVKQWVDKTNEIFAHASVRFVYDPDSDFATLKSTLLNSMIGDADTNWNDEVDFGNQVAARYPGALVAFFRHGPEQGSSGGGFSSATYNFVVMPGFNTSVCGYQNAGALAHEIGHYFGLSHTFAKVFTSIQEAESYFTTHGNNPNVFDGDGLRDTLPDPYVLSPEMQCKPTQSITLNGREFPLPRQNIMSYYSNGPIVDRTELTPQQSDLLRSVLGMRERNGMAMPTNSGVPRAIEFATLPIKDRVEVSASVQDMTPWGAKRWSEGKQLFCGAQPNGVIRFSVSVGAIGKYALNLYATMAPDFGQIQTILDDKPLGAPIDLHAPFVWPSGKISIGSIDLSAGTHNLGFRVVGKNIASNGYSFGLDAFTLTPGQK